MIDSSDIIKLDKIIVALKNYDHPLNNLLNEFKLYQDLAGISDKNNYHAFLVYCQGISNEVITLRQDVNQLASMVVKLAEQHRSTFVQNNISDYEIGNIRNISYRLQNSQQIQIQY